MNITGYLLNLGFYPDKGPVLGPDYQRLAWTVAAYLLLVSGIFAQQNFCLSPVRVCGDHADVHVALGSALLGLAVLPIMLRWFNAKFRKPSWEHVLFAFSIGFFLDLSSDGLKALAAKVGLL